MAHKVEIQVAYAIGVADPVSINVETFGTEQGVTRGQIAAAVRKVFDLRPAAIIDELDLKRPIYLKTAAYGHFGRLPLVTVEGTRFSSTANMPLYSEAC